MTDGKVLENQIRWNLKESTYNQIELLILNK
jgi:hypothetical protein